MYCVQHKVTQPRLRKLRETVAGQKTIQKAQTELKQKTTRDVELLCVNQVPTNAHSSQSESRLYIFEDSEAVIKMIIKGRSGTMRHVSRTHRVALYWLFDRINLDPKIQIKFVDTKNQLADILTEGNFTRDEWNHLLCLFNISLFSFQSCTQTMSKRTQEGTDEERIAATSKPVKSLVSRSRASFLNSANFDGICKPGEFQI